MQRRGREYWLPIINDLNSSGLTRVEFARSRGVALPSLYHWIKKLARDSATSDSAPAADYRAEQPRPDSDDSPAAAVPRDAGQPELTDDVAVVEAHDLGRSLSPRNSEAAAVGDVLSDALREGAAEARDPTRSRRPSTCVAPTECRSVERSPRPGTLSAVAETTPSAPRRESVGPAPLEFDFELVLDGGTRLRFRNGADTAYLQRLLEQLDARPSTAPPCDCHPRCHPAPPA